MACGPWAVGWRGGFGAGGVLVRDWARASADASSWPLGELLGARQGPEPLCTPADPAGDMGPGLASGSTAAALRRSSFPLLTVLLFAKFELVVSLGYGADERWSRWGYVVSVCDRVT